MSSQQNKDFLKDLFSEFDGDKDTSHYLCYTLDSNPSIKIIVFGKIEWEQAHIGILVNGEFHVLGVGALGFINEPVKKLYIPFKNCGKNENQLLKANPVPYFTGEEEKSIREKLIKIFTKDKEDK